MQCLLEMYLLMQYCNICTVGFAGNNSYVCTWMS
jgi:hypothetical protein